MDKFHLAERECVAQAIDAAAKAPDLDSLYEAIRTYEGHDLAKESAYTPSQTTDIVDPIMIVTEKPEDKDREEGRPFSGEYGTIMRNATGLVGIDLDSCHIGYAIHWTPQDDKSPNKTQIAASRPFLYREIELVKPRVILAQGRAVIESLAHYRGSVLEIYGQTMKFRHGDVYVQMYMTAHPAYCMYSGTYFSTFVENLKEFFARHGREEERTVPGTFEQKASIHADEDLAFPRIRAA